MNEHPDPAPPAPEQPGITGSLARIKKAVDEIFNKHLYMTVTQEGDRIAVRYATRIGGAHEAECHYKVFHSEVCEVLRRMTDAEAEKVYDAQVAVTTQRKRAEKAEEEAKRVGEMLTAARSVEADRTRVAIAGMEAQRKRAEKAEAMLGAIVEARRVDSESESTRHLPDRDATDPLIALHLRLTAVELALSRIGRKPNPWHDPNIQPQHVDCSRRCTEPPPQLDPPAPPPCSSFGCDGPSPNKP